jgi:ABC-type antimicrobial peptide transport system permease subunit
VELRKDLPFGRERRREIGMLKAIGYSGRGVLGEILVENCLLAVAAATAAMLIVTLAITVVGRLAFQTSFGASPLDVLGIIVVTTALCAGTAWTMARHATRIPPLEALRYE